MKSKIKRLVVFWAGWGFISLGVVGLLLPVVPQTIFFLIGLSLLANTSPWAARLLNRIKERFPSVTKTLEEAVVRARDFQIKLFRKKEDKEAGRAES
jgi:uncharacterized membrane protein YbaN (DUF454 family)